MQEPVTHAIDRLTTPPGPNSLRNIIAGYAGSAQLAEMNTEIQATGKPEDSDYSVLGLSYARSTVCGHIHQQYGA